ncbi:MAG: Rho termination factor N-terminal domain-containing protein [Candidatus Izemoplasmatales bacterium]
MEDEEVVVAKPVAKAAVKPVVVKVTSQPKKEEVVAEVKPEVKPETKPEVKVVEVNLEAKTVAELKVMAKDLNLNGYSALKKAELIDLIKKAL